MACLPLAHACYNSLFATMACVCLLQWPVLCLPQWQVHVYYNGLFATMASVFATMACVGYNGMCVFACVCHNGLFLPQWPVFDTMACACHNGLCLPVCYKYNGLCLPQWPVFATMACVHQTRLKIYIWLGHTLDIHSVISIKKKTKTVQFYEMEMNTVLSMFLKFVIDQA